MTLEQVQAFVAIRELLTGKRDGTSFECPAHPPLERLRQVVAGVGKSPSALDRAVLLRHALMYARAPERVWGGESPTLRVPRGSGWLESVADWAAVGLQARGDDTHWILSASPWRPDWLRGVTLCGIDESAAFETPCRFDSEDVVVGDPFLGQVGHTHYRSVGQRAAVRSALLTPPGATLLIDLPTGEGKSLVFHVIDRIGFTSTPSSGTRGVTLVVVPTIALALDHASNSRRTDSPGPFAYVGGETEANGQLLERIRTGEQELCFASPEAVCGPMRHALIKAAESGHLKAIVIDEAHLVDGWGTGFRTEFQLLSGIRRELIALSPSAVAPRTILLSATLTIESITTLQQLFAGPGRFESVSAARVRPEPEFWVGGATDDEERQRRVLEALLHAPRPALLYVTRVSHAKDWFQRLCGRGFRRIRQVHGETSTHERQEVLDLWRIGQLDLVVATSAFGLGIDYPHVRSVIHACIPETLDRFYQEVGRGGRDGRKCLSLVLPSKEDYIDAGGLNQQVTISIERGLQRWHAMFHHRSKQSIAFNKFRIRLDVPPGHNEADIDMVSERNEDWNARTLTLMTRSGLIRLTGNSSAQPEPDDSMNMALELEVLEPDHLEHATWVQKVTPVRDRIAKANRENLDLMTRHLERSSCPADLLADLYGSEKVVRNCGGCAICRLGNPRHPPLGHQSEPPVPWTAGALSQRILKLLDPQRRLVVFYDPGLGDWLQRDSLCEILLRLTQEGLHNVVLLGKLSSHVEETLTVLHDKPVFISRVERLAMRKLPRGPLFVIAGGLALTTENLAEQRPGEERILLVPTNTDSPSRPGILLSDVYPGRTMTLDELRNRVVA